MTYEKISLKEMQRHGQDNLTLEDEFTFEDLPMTGPVKVQARIVLTSTGAMVNGKVKGQSEEPCDRCMEPFARDIISSFADRFIYHNLAEWSGGEHELNEEDFCETIGPDMILDLGDLVHQHLVLALSVDRMCERETCELAGV